MNRLILLLVSIFLITIAGCGGSESPIGESPIDGSPTGGSPTGGSPTGGSLTWNAPTLNVDGSPLTDLAGYKIYFGQLSGNYNDTDSPQDIACRASCACNPGVTCTYLVPGNLLGTGQWCFVITAYDTSLNESPYSSEMCATL